MKFKIRYADQIVGFFSTAALVGLVVLIFALGVKQNWFMRKNMYTTEFESGSNISVGMDILYKGFSIGKIKSIKLEDDKVKVQFYVLEDYVSYIKSGSLVQVIVSPIGLGSQFVFLPGKGPGLVPSGSEIYRVDSETGQSYIEQGLNDIVIQTDSLGALLAKVSIVVDNVNKITGEINNALTGKGSAPLTTTLANIQKITANISTLSATISDPTGLVPTMLGPAITKRLNDILSNVSSVTNQLNALSQNTDQLVKQSSPEIDTILTQLNEALIQAQDVLTGIKNNPLIRNGIPDKSQNNTAVSQARSSDF
jgi:phospholipid/cholesterol/gamma-HCH transport system substrate-binding protein